MKESAFACSLGNIVMRSAVLGTAFLAGMKGMLTAQTPQRPHIIGISHIALLAHDYEKSRAFYGEFLGFQEPYGLKNPDGSVIMTFFKS